MAKFPQRPRGTGNKFNSPQHLLPSDSKFLPAPSTVFEILDQREQAIHRVGKDGLSGFGLLELIPESKEPGTFVVREHSENAPGRLLFGLEFSRLVGVADLIARIDLDQVVNQQHLDHPQGIQRGFNPGNQADRGQGQAPAVLGRILLARQTDRPGRSLHRLQFVRLNQKPNGAANIHAEKLNARCDKATQHLDIYSVGPNSIICLRQGMNPALSQKEATVIRESDGTRKEVRDPVAIEEPLEIRIQFPHPRSGDLVEESLAVTMRTPGNDRELALGFLYSEGVITHPGELLSIEQLDASHNVTASCVISLKERPERLSQPRTTLANSSCGICSKRSASDIALPHPPQFAAMHPQIHRDQLRQLPAAMRASQPLFHSTGGIHAAGLFNQEGTLELLMEDVGRHNALDKLIGWAFLQDRLPLEKNVLLVSGRIGFELAQKSLNAGIPILAAIGAPSSLAVEVANQYRQTLVGFLNEQRFNIYSHPQRIA